MCAALERGLSLRDFDDMTVGMIIGYITMYNERNSDEREKTTREATQDDIDAFYAR